MLIPLLLTLFSHGRPVKPNFLPLALRPKATPHRAGRIKREGRIKTAVMGEVQFVMLVPPPQFSSSDAPLPSPASLALLPARRLMPLTMSLRLDTRAQEGREEADLISAINNERRRYGLEPLTEDPLLNTTARAHSHEMCSLDYFDHCSPTGGWRTPLDRYLASLHSSGESKPDTILIGENIFYAGATNSVYNAAYAHTSLMNSPNHRANILEPRFTKVGVGLYRDGQGRFWVTEMFLRDMQ